MSNVQSGDLAMIVLAGRESDPDAGKIVQVGERVACWNNYSSNYGTIPVHVPHGPSDLVWNCEHRHGLVIAEDMVTGKFATGPVAPIDDRYLRKIAGPDVLPEMEDIDAPIEQEHNMLEKIL